MNKGNTNYVHKYLIYSIKTKYCELQTSFHDETMFSGNKGIDPLTLHDPTMMLLMGMWISLTKKPMKPIMQKPMAVAIAIFWNSFLSGLVHLFTSLTESLENWRPGSNTFVT